jgi:hypothetical protein
MLNVVIEKKEYGDVAVSGAVMEAVKAEALILSFHARLRIICRNVDLSINTPLCHKF